MTYRDLEKRQAYTREWARRRGERQRSGRYKPREILAFSQYLGEQDPETGCIEWKGAHNNGHPAATSASRPIFQGNVAYKAAWLIAQLLLTGKPVPWPRDDDGLSLEAAHLCRNATCVNWEHIQPMTTEEHLAYDWVAEEKLTPTEHEELRRLEALPVPF